MSSLTQPGAQWVIGKAAAIPIQGATFYQATNGDWIATTNPADAMGHVTGVLIEPDGIWSSVFNPLYGTGISPVALSAALTPAVLVAHT